MFIEIMACGEVSGGGGQPFPVNDKIGNLRAQSSLSGGLRTPIQKIT